MLIDLHSHTSVGSACAYQSPEELIAAAKQTGLDGVCLTEHDWLWSERDLQRLREKNDFLVLGGVEVTTELGEVLVFGMHTPTYNISRISDLRALVDEAGGMIVACHPFRGYLMHHGRHALGPEFQPAVREASGRELFAYVDALEVFNGRSFEAEMEFACEVSRALSLPGTGGSDTHSVITAGTCATWFDETIRDESQLVAAMRAGRFKAFHRSWNRWF